MQHRVLVRRDGAVRAIDVELHPEGVHDQIGDRTANDANVRIAADDAHDATPSDKGRWTWELEGIPQGRRWNDAAPRRPVTRAISKASRDPAWGRKKNRR